MKKSVSFSIRYILGLVYALTPIMACMLPIISVSLSIPRANIQFILTAIFAGMFSAKIIAVSGFSYKFGNKKSLLYNLPISIMGVCFCFFSSFILLIFGCFLMGLGIGMIMSICADLARLEKKKPYSQTWSHLNQIPIWSPILVTFICGLLMHYTAWQINLVLALVLIITGWLLVYIFIPDDNIQEKVEVKEPKKTIIKRLLTSPLPLCYMIIYSLLTSIQSIFYTTAPFIFIKDLEIPQHYFFIFVFIFILGSFLGFRLNIMFEKSMQHKTIILLSCCLALIASIFFLITDLISSINVYSIMAAFFLLAICRTLIFPSITKYFADKFKQYLVIATALSSAILSLASAALSASSAYLLRTDIEDLSTLCIGITLVTFIAAIVSWFLQKE